MTMTETATSAKANLEIVNLVSLCAGEPAEEEKLRRACIQTGFFYLNLKGYGSLEAEWYELLQFSQNYFASTTEDKMKDARGSDVYGYEPLGTSAGVHPGTVDGYESLKFSRDPPPSNNIPLSATATRQSPLIINFISSVHTVLLKILSSLLDTSEPPVQKLVTSSHDPDSSSRSTLSLFKYAKQAASTAQGHNKHTDLGTLTFLLSLQPGPQVLAPGHAGWLDVVPRAGCAIINVGDSLRFLSNCKFLSAVHRVVPVAENATRDRFSIAYFLRPNDSVVISRDQVSGEEVTAEKWHDFKFDVFRQSHEEQEGELYATGGMAAEGDEIHVSRNSSEIVAGVGLVV